MKIEDVQVLGDSELAQVIAWAEDEQKRRTERKKQEAIARMKELALSVGVTVTIAGQRGRPPKSKREGAKEARNGR